MMKLLNCTCGDKWKEYAPLLLRLVLGAIFIVHGYQKIERGVGPTAEFLETLNIPLPVIAAVLLITAELVGGIFLVLGLFTHWTSKILAFVALVALLTVHIGNGFTGQGGYEFILLILVGCLSLMLTGGGKWALDKKLKKTA
jgi:putative oxidoreductase